MAKKKATRSERKRRGEFFRRPGYERREWLRRVQMAGLRDEERPACGGKVSYRDYGDAMRAARVMYASDGGTLGAMCVYRCASGKPHFHVGHQYVLRILP